ncbi:hypothetical protein [Xenorhabdus bovienii]|uniref:hypothetical protein n=1 Tax=Xenorhabdus bovienii TaxID=40576 RepID=UPI00237D0A56|nr:hypothetical protein [Xenorhabdus bovienii]MDE1496129.1 hypothetical protein [Xenorhabdus bovienii]MDE9455617.1 hypothetical protein [Xenorhabdus bovienii]MDE9455779.1 hypothetical protein [Xenorhabdus bovienii]MDE9464691.1 hypothetical protein [Xenorhabdus bovienii]MDE9474157.1 hypothetical protein [Xenorhabdus bovienii]
MNVQGNKPDTTAIKNNEFPDAAIREADTVTLNNAVDSDNQTFGFGSNHTNFSNSNFGA